MSKSKYFIGTRASRLALWQANAIKRLVETEFPKVDLTLVPFTTAGDKTLEQPLPQIGGKGLFTAELEEALRAGRIDLAVHSLKDLPVESSPGLTLGAICEREDVRDVLISPGGQSLAELPAGAVIGTSSLRRQAQILAHRPDLLVRSIRGNVDTRIKKAAGGDYDAVVLAAAGVTRLGLDAHITEWLPLDLMLPAPGQGALAVQCRVDDPATLGLLAVIDEANVRRCVLAERAFLSALGGGCTLPIGAHATNGAGVLRCVALVADEAGRRVIRVFGSGTDPERLGRRLAGEAIDKGARSLMP